MRQNIFWDWEVKEKNFLDQLCQIKYFFLRACLKSFLIPDFGKNRTKYAKICQNLPKSGIKKDLRQTLK